MKTSKAVPASSGQAAPRAAAQGHRLADSLAQSAPMARQRQHIAQCFGAGQPPVQAYFDDRSRPTPFKGVFRQASQGDIDLVARYLAQTRSQEEAEAFLREARSDARSGELHEWVETRLGTDLETMRIREFKQQFPQTAPIPDPWISDTRAHNPGGPPFIVKPPYLSSPSSSQEQETHVDDEGVQPTDMTFDATQDSFTYHRNKTTYPVTPTNRSELRAGAMLTNSFVDFTSAQGRSLIGRSTAPIKKETDAIREKERRRVDHGSKVLSHHPDTYWTSRPHSEMGFHPVEKGTNTLEGDANDLSSRGGKPLTGLLIRESGGLTRPTLEAYDDHLERAKAVDALVEQLDASEGADLAERLLVLRRVVDEAGELPLTRKARVRWEHLHAVLDRIEREVREPRATWVPLGMMARNYLEQTYDRAQESTSTAQELLDSIASALRGLPDASGEALRDEEEEDTGSADFDALSAQLDEAETARLHERLAVLRRVVDEAQDLAESGAALARWQSLHDVLERVEIEMQEPPGERASLGELARNYLEQTYDRQDESMLPVQSLLDDIAAALRKLP